MSYKKLSSIGNSSKENYESIVPEIKTLTEKETLINSNKICVVDVYATWCSPCNIAAPLYNELYKQYNVPGVCAIAKENVELHLSKEVQVIPTFQIYFNGKPDSVVTGIDIKSIEDKIKILLENI